MTECGTEYQALNNQEKLYFVGPRFTAKNNTYNRQTHKVTFIILFKKIKQKSTIHCYEKYRNN